MLIREQFTVNMDVQSAWDFFTDVTRFAPLLPGVGDVKKIDDHSYRMVLRQKISYIEAEFDVLLRIGPAVYPDKICFSTEGKGLQVPATLRTKDEVVLRAVSTGSEPVTEVTYTSDVVLSGTLATLGGLVIRVKAGEIIGAFKKRVIKELSGSASD